MAKILVIDDEPDILALIKNILQKDNHLVTTVVNPEKILTSEFSNFDLILLDVMMPGMDGFTFCKEIRGIVDCPIIFLTAKTMEIDIMYGLGLGADDYITKPFGVGELRARVNAYLRRENRERRITLCVSGVKFDLAGKDILVDDKKIPFTKSEYNICEFLARNQGQVFSKDKIYEGVYGYDGESDSSAITEHVKNIRAKIAVFELSPIETVWGIGYKWK
ncbi:response regulator transcription factor [Clostridium sp. CM028]|uniref:response regulator transcription factor n=1 Tax=unclassified Clostridium TaxID=2614128 RepID=UPI001C0E188F|nr:MULTISPECIES: response regulator transcription factor [unclassified Clostridium]MBU3092184.1 response regulator transcription factor [Clostridium sp. CF011]MBW9146455.1 response regulator transcription factor [Clostridium sp. CM027]MBW9149154.1 response regulator transcription factor [Clostridium sp. CM028]UVE41957.1 response regulator transcription factor [Clostridium sp. CM027]WAG70975.1 response regulator transcription factor [Clostridium sp. CF011]